MLRLRASFCLLQTFILLLAELPHVSSFNHSSLRQPGNNSNPVRYLRNFRGTGIEDRCPSASSLSVPECTEDTKSGIYVSQGRGLQRDRFVFLEGSGIKKFQERFPMNISKDAAILVCNYNNYGIHKNKSIVHTNDLRFSLPTLVQSVTSGVSLRVQIVNSLNIDLNADLNIGGREHLDERGAILDEVIKAAGKTLEDVHIAVEVWDSLNVKVGKKNVRLSIEPGSIMEDLIAFDYEEVRGGSSLFVDMKNSVNIHGGKGFELFIGDDGQLQDEAIFLSGSAIGESAEGTLNITVLKDKVAEVRADFVHISHGELTDETVDISRNLENSDLYVRLNNTGNILQAGRFNISSGELVDEVVDISRNVDNSRVEIVVQNTANVAVQEDLYIGIGKCIEDEVDSNEPDEYPEKNEEVEGDGDEYNSEQITDDDFNDDPKETPENDLADTGAELLDETFDVGLDVTHSYVLISLEDTARAIVGGGAYITDSELVDELFDVRSVTDTHIDISLKRVAQLTANSVKLSCSSELLDETVDVERGLERVTTAIRLEDVGNVVSDSWITIWDSELVDEVIDVERITQSDVRVELVNVANSRAGADVTIGNRDLDGCSPEFVTDVDRSGNDQGGELLDEVIDVEEDVIDSKIYVSVKHAANIERAADVFITESELAGEIFDVKFVRNAEVNITLDGVSNIEKSKRVYVGCGELQDEVFDLGETFSNGRVNIWLNNVGNVKDAELLRIKDGELVDEVFDVAQVVDCNCEIHLKNVANVMLQQDMVLGNPNFDCINVNESISDLGSELLDEVLDIEENLLRSNVTINMAEVANVMAGLGGTVETVRIIEGEITDEVVDVGAIIDSHVTIDMKKTANVNCRSLSIECGEIMDEIVDVEHEIANSLIDVQLFNSANVYLQEDLFIFDGEITDEIIDAQVLSGANITLDIRNTSNIYGGRDVTVVDGELMDEIVDVEENIVNTAVNILLANSANVVISGRLNITEGEITDEIVDAASLFNSAIRIDMRNTANIVAGSADILEGEVTDEIVDIEEVVRDATMEVQMSNCANIELTGGLYIKGGEITDEIIDAGLLHNAAVLVNVSNTGNVEAKDAYILDGELMDEIIDVEGQILNSNLQVGVTNCANVAVHRDLRVIQGEISDEIIDAQGIETSSVLVNVSNVANIKRGRHVDIFESELMDEVIDIEWGVESTSLEVMLTNCANVDIRGKLSIIKGELADEIVDAAFLSNDKVLVTIENIANIKAEGVSISGGEVVDEIIDIDSQVRDSIVQVRLTDSANIHSSGSVIINSGEVTDEIIDAGSIINSATIVNVQNTANIAANTIFISGGEVMDEIVHVKYGIQNSALDVVMYDAGNAHFDSLSIERGEILEDVVDANRIAHSVLNLEVDKVANMKGRIASINCGELMDEIINVNTSIVDTSINVQLTNSALVDVSGPLFLRSGKLMDGVIEAGSFEKTKFDVTAQHIANVRARNILSGSDRNCCGELHDTGLLDVEAVSKLMDKTVYARWSARNAFIYAQMYECANVMVEEKLGMEAEDIMDTIVCLPEQNQSGNHVEVKHMNCSHIHIIDTRKNE